MLVTMVGTVSVSALLWLPMPKLVIKLGPALNGELQTCALFSVTTITPLVAVSGTTNLVALTA